MWNSTTLVVVVYSFGCRIHDAAATREQLQKMHFGGRWWQDGNKMNNSWGVGAFIVQFRGSSQLTLKMNSGYASGLHYTCQINDGVETKLYHPHSDEFLTIATNLDTSSEYIISCGRNNEASWGTTTISSVILDVGGELLPVADPNADGNMLRIEFVGDSITNGFKVTAQSASEPATIDNQDVFLAYPRLLADAFNTSDYQVIARSGKGIILGARRNQLVHIILKFKWPITVCRSQVYQY